MTTLTQLKERWSLGCLLYLLLFNFPVLLIFNGTRPVLGIPALVCYLFAAWLAFIVLAFLFARRLGRERQGGDEPEGEP